MSSTITSQAKKIISELLELFEISIKEITVAKPENGELKINIAVPDESSGILIGYHGETLNALQYLLGQILNQDQSVSPALPAGRPLGGKEWLRISLNLNNYRDQREVELKQMAKNAADRAISTGDEIEMPSLTPAERRIIHLELTNRADVTSFSEGEGRSRRLVISPKKKES